MIGLRLLPLALIAWVFFTDSLLRPASAADPSISTVDYVNCPTRTNADPEPTTPDPPSTRKLRLPSEQAKRLAIYQGDFGPAVLAPKGWRCEFGASGSYQSLRVQPSLNDDAQFVRVEVFDGPASTYTFAQIAGALFPEYQDLVKSAKSSQYWRKGAEVFEVPSTDRIIRRIGETTVEFETPAGKEGLGTFGGSKPGAAPIHGLAIVYGHPDAALYLLRARLSPGDAGLIRPIVNMMNESVPGSTDVYASISWNPDPKVDWQKLPGKWSSGPGCSGETLEVNAEGRWVSSSDPYVKSRQFTINAANGEICLWIPDADANPRCLRPRVLSDLEFTGTGDGPDLGNPTKQAFSYRRCAASGAEAGERGASNEGGGIAGESEPVTDREYMYRQVQPFLEHPIVGWASLCLALALLALVFRPGVAIGNRFVIFCFALIALGPFVWRNHEAIAQIAAGIAPRIEGSGPVATRSSTPTMIDINECIRRADPGDMGKEFLWRLLTTCARELAIPMEIEKNIELEVRSKSGDLVLKVLNEDLVVVELDVLVKEYDDLGRSAEVARWKLQELQEIGERYNIADYLERYPTTIDVGSSVYGVNPSPVGLHRVSGNSRKLSGEQRCSETRPHDQRSCWQLEVSSFKGFLIGDWVEAKARYAGWTSSPWKRLQDCIKDHSWAAHWFSGSNQRSRFKCAEALSSELPTDAFPDVSEYGLTTHYEDKPDLSGRACWHAPCPAPRTDWSISEVRLAGGIRSKTVKYLITGVHMDLVIRDNDRRPRKALSIVVGPLWLANYFYLGRVSLRREAFADEDWVFLSEMHTRSMRGRSLNHLAQRRWWCGDPGSEGRLCWELIVRRVRGVPYSPAS